MLHHREGPGVHNKLTVELLSQLEHFYTSEAVKEWGFLGTLMNYQAKICINLASKPIINTFGLILTNKFYYLSVMKMKYECISVI